MNESEWQRLVEAAARGAGWSVAVAHPSLSDTGTPDLTLTHHAAGLLVFAELKTDAGVVSPAQRRTLQALARLQGVKAYVWRPADIDAVNAVLLRASLPPSGQFSEPTQLQQPRTARIEQVIGEVSTAMSVSIDDMRSEDRSPRITYARHVAMLLLASDGQTLQRTGAALGGRAHSTVRHGIKDRRADVGDRLHVETIAERLGITVRWA